MTGQSLISDLSGVESPLVATARCISFVFCAMALGSWRCTRSDLVCAQNA